MSTCLSCAWISPCYQKCFNPYYINICENNVLPASPEIFCCIRYENKETRLPDSQNLAIMASQSFANPT